MKIAKYLFVGTLIINMTALAQIEEGEELAADTGEVKTEIKPSRQKTLYDKHFEVGPEIASFKYKEPGLMQDSGTLYGIRGSFFHELETDPIFVFADFNLLLGNTTYKGSLVNLNTGAHTPKTDKSRNTITNIRGGGGLFITKSHNSYSGAFLGLGVRGLTNKVAGEGSYTREINYLYFPFGVTGRQTLSGNWFIGGSAEYDLFVAGSVRSKLSEADSRLDDVTTHQESGRGHRLSLTSGIDMDSTSILFEIYHQYWKVDESTVGFSGLLGFVEPANETTINGLNISMLF